MDNKQFYSIIKFPGLYSIKDIKQNNNYLNTFIDYDVKSILDLGCGSGLISNYIAYRNPKVNIVSVDFSDAIDFASNFSKEHNINNITYLKEDITKLNLETTFDLVLCNGVLHHVENFQDAIDIIKKHAKEYIIIGVYNTVGKIIQKTLKPKYKSEVYNFDQYLVPYSTSWFNRKILNMFSEYEVGEIIPSCNNKFVNLCNLKNYHNGGLTIYKFKKSSESRKSYT